MKKITIGIIGLGNIGSSVADVIHKNHSAIMANAGVDIQIKKVCDVRRPKTNLSFTTDAFEIINDPEIDIVVEAIGGTSPALKFVLAALKAGKSVVTPNKELIAKHLRQLYQAAYINNVSIMFEASVGGGIPIIQPLRQSLSANKLSEVYGIVNGTTNYILSKMTEEGVEFNQALKEAQKLGYAEPNPAADIKGYDAAYKAAILASVAFGVEVNWQKV